MNPLKGQLRKYFINNDKGLTLIELLAVILILGILAAITIPVITGQGEGARIQSHKDIMNSIETAASRYDLEEGFKTSQSTDDYAVVDEKHPMIIKGYLDELPINPWKGTNAEQNEFVYIITKDVRDSKKAFLVDWNGNSIERVLLLEDDTPVVKTLGESGLKFIDDVNDFLTDMEDPDYLNYFYFNP